MICSYCPKKLVMFGKFAIIKPLEATEDSRVFVSIIQNIAVDQAHRVREMREGRGQRSVAGRRAKEVERAKKEGEED